MPQENRWSQMSIAFLLLLTLAIGTFAAGYRNGIANQQRLELQEQTEAQRAQRDADSEMAEMYSHMPKEIE